MPNMDEVLAALEENGGATQAEIAGLFDVPTQQVHSQLKSLMLKGVVRRRAEGQRYGGVWHYYTQGSVTVDEWREMGEKREKGDW